VGLADEAVLERIMVTQSDNGVPEKYKISDIDDPYYGFLRSDGSWYVMSISGTEVRYAKGESDYATNWTGRAGLDYGFYSDTF
jgi:hypothetical protein